MKASRYARALYLASSESGEKPLFPGSGLIGISTASTTWMTPLEQSTARATRTGRRQFTRQVAARHATSGLAGARTVGLDDLAADDSGVQALLANLLAADAHHALTPALGVQRELHAPRVQRRDAAERERYGRREEAQRERAGQRAARAERAAIGVGAALGRWARARGRGAPGRVDHVAAGGLALAHVAARAGGNAGQRARQRHAGTARARARASCALLRVARGAGPRRVQLIARGAHAPPQPQDIAHERHYPCRERGARTPRPGRAAAGAHKSRTCVSISLSFSRPSRVPGGSAANASSVGCGGLARQRRKPPADRARCGHAPRRR